MHKMHQEMLERTDLLLEISETIDTELIDHFITTYSNNINHFVTLKNLAIRV